MTPFAQVLSLIHWLLFKINLLQLYRYITNSSLPLLTLFIYSLQWYCGSGCNIVVIVVIPILSQKQRADNININIYINININIYCNDTCNKVVIPILVEKQRVDNRTGLALHLICILWHNQQIIQATDARTI